MTASALPRTLEIFSDSRTSGATTGPTSSAQTHTFRLNANNPTDNNYTTYTPTTTVTYNISSVYNYSKYSSRGSSTNPDFTMGGSINNSGDFITSRGTFSPLNTIGDPINGNFSASIQNAPTGCAGSSNSCSSGTTGGINTSSNYGMALFTSTSGLAANSRTLNGRHRVGTITATFNRAVTNPVLHLAGLGGSVGNQGFTAEFDLVNSASATGVTMSRLSGSSGFSVTSTRIANSNLDISATTGSGGASGSVYLQGRRITSLTFDVYVRGDGNGTSWSSSAGIVGGDLFFFGVSSLDEDNDISITKSQRLATAGNTNTFAQTQLNVIAGQDVEYQLEIINNTINPVLGATYSDTIPSGLINNSSTDITILSNTASGGATQCTASKAGATISGTFSGPMSSKCTVTIRVRAQNTGQFSNTATIFESATDNIQSNNTSTVNILVGTLSGNGGYCTPDMYMSAGTAAFGNVTLKSINTAMNPFSYSDIGSAQAPYNSTAVSPKDGYVYGIKEVQGTGSIQLYKIGDVSPNRAVPVNWGDVSGLKLTGYNAGDIDSSGTYYVLENSSTSSTNRLGVITIGDTANSSTAVMRNISGLNGITVNDIADGGDGYLYGVGSSTGILYKIPKAGGAVIPVNSTRYPSPTTFGSMFGSVNGDIYGSENSGGFYKFDKNTGARILLSNSLSSGNNDGAHCVTQPITNLPVDLVITKTDNSSTYRAGTTVTYTIVVSNNGLFGVSGATVSDPLPTGITTMTYTATAANGATTSKASGTHTGALSDTVSVPVGGTVTYQVTVTVPSSFTGELINTATVAAPSGFVDTDTDNNTATDENQQQSANLAISKTNNVDNLVVQGTTSYSILVENLGPNSADNAILKDPAVTGLTKTGTTINCTATAGAVCPTAANRTVALIESASGIVIPTLPSGGTLTFTISANVTALNGTVSNTATIAVPVGIYEEDTANNSATDTDSVYPRANLGITKTDSQTAMNAGGTTTYDIVVSNSSASTSPVSNAIFTDPAVTGLTKTAITCASVSGSAVCPAAADLTIANVEAATGIVIPSLPVNSSLRFTITASVTAESGNVSNVANIAMPAGGTDTDTTNNSATDTNSVTPRADLGVVKTQRAGTSGTFTRDPVSIVPLGVLGSVVEYQLVMTNNGPATVTGATFADIIPSPFVFNSFQESTPTSGNGATACTATNSGNTVTGTFSGPSGATCRVVIRATAPLLAATGTYTNTATVNRPNTIHDPDTTNNSSSVETAIAPAADMAIEKLQSLTNGSFAVTDLTVNQGSNVFYQIKVTNNGPTGIGGLLTGTASFTDTVPTNITNLTLLTAGTTACPAPTINGQTVSGAFSGASGASCTYIVQGTATTVGSITNTATVSSTGLSDTVTSNNSSAVNLTIVPAADLEITKSDSLTSTYTGDEVTYTIAVTNKGPSAANGALFKDAAVTGLSKTSLTCAASNGASCPLAPDLNIANIESTNGLAIPTLPNGGVVTFTVKANVTATSGNVSNVATITAPSGTTDPVTTNNSATDTDSVSLPPADLSITKTDGVTATHTGDEVTYTVVVTNNGPRAANGALFRDAVATGLTKTSVTCSATNSASCPLATDLTISNIESTNGLAIPTLPNGGVVTFTIKANVTATSGNVSNVATITAPSGTTDPVSTNNSATDTDSVSLPPADLSITKTDGVTATYTGDEVTYTVVVTNNGPRAANGALFRDAVATGLTKTSVTCSATNSASCPLATDLTISNIESTNGLAIPTLPNGGVVTFTIKANVTATSGNVSNVATITAPSGTTDPVSTNNSATDTDSVLTPIVIQGKVFEDNSGTTGIASNAYNAVQNTGEVGIANSAVQLTNCSGTVLATTETDAMGQYQFAVRQATLPSPNFCVVQTNVEGYTSVSGSTGYTRGTDTITVPKATSGNYTDLNFGDVKLNLILTENGQHTVVAGAVTDYPHRLQTDATVQVTGITQTLNQQPSSASDQDWQALIYRDSNCNGTVDAGEALFNPTTSAPVSLLPSAGICLVQRVHVPTNVYAGAQHNAQLEASYSVTLSNPADTLTGDSNTVQDTTLTGSAGLELSKKVRKVSSCPSTAADTDVFSTVNEATTLDKLEYEITYKNNSVKNLQNVKIKDAVPTGTTFGSISCQSTPSGNSCDATRTGEALLWQLTGNLSPASSGTVRFCVTPQ
ncbi:hypothetical protein MKI79_07165 [Acinetobacter sp. A3.8]|uniref:DUF11 domain-containing protein n=1 Tax=Acinetobacter sedimenti TaxID=2919922 RepID=A0A9X2B6F9_9GAMM|nr:SdrD B-like domain-containing protein [Acinetobacter sedimenti]MCJ8146678.1 hypothetical protein [Acinetobacter sedimenti]